MILTRIKNEKSKTGFKNINKHVLFEFKCRFDVKKCNSNQKWNKDKYRCKCKNILQKIMSAKNIYIWNPATCSCKNGRFAGIIISDAVIMCGEIIEEKKSTSTNFNEKK